jgi:dynein heavy chain
MSYGGVYSRLCIGPKLVVGSVQGVLWVKEREARNALKVVRMGAPSLLTTMERAIEAGNSVLIENMGETIDAVLGPVITRSTFKKVRFSH